MGDSYFQTTCPGQIFSSMLAPELLLHQLIRCKPASSSPRTFHINVFVRVQIFQRQRGLVISPALLCWKQLPI